MRISEFHKQNRDTIPLEKVGRSKGVRRRWRETKRNEANRRNEANTPDTTPRKDLLT